jgi:transposase
MLKGTILMASINKQSIREEVEKIKSDFELLAANKKLNIESKILFQSMFMLINLLVSIFLEKTTKKNNKNSSLPSSQTEKDTSSTQKTNTKREKESNLLAQNTRTVETVFLAKVTECDICGTDLRKVDCEHIERRTKIDIVFEKVIQHVDAEVKHCEECDATVKGIFPSDMQGPLQYGNGIKAYVINLVICQMISLNRIQKMVKTIMGEMLSESTLLKFVFRFYELLASWEEKTKTELLKSIVTARPSLRTK